MQAMLSGIDMSAVGLLLLNRNFLGTEGPMRELTRILQQRKGLPVLYNTSHKVFAAEMLQELGQIAADMLRQLEPINIVQHTTQEEPVDFRQNICFAVLRRLATVCCPGLSGGSAADLLFLMRCRDALDHICSEDAYTELRAKYKEQAREWLEELNVQCRRMGEVGGPLTCMIMVSVPPCQLYENT